MRFKSAISTLIFLIFLAAFLGVIFYNGGLREYEEPLPAILPKASPMLVASIVAKSAERPSERPWVPSDIISSPVPTDGDDAGPNRFDLPPEVPVPVAEELGAPPFPQQSEHGVSPFVSQGIVAP